MRKVILLVAIMALLMAGSVVSAQDELPEGVTADNWCLEGEVWEGYCNSEDEDVLWWQWTCGWYFAQTELGNIPLAPWWCATQMPAGCYMDVNYGWVYSLGYSGNANEADNADETLDFDGSYCAGFPDADAIYTMFGIVFALSPDQATEQCQAIDPDYFALPLLWYGYDLGPDAYFCVSY